MKKKLLSHMHSARLWMSYEPLQNQLVSFARIIHTHTNLFCHLSLSAVLGSKPLSRFQVSFPSTQSLWPRLVGCKRSSLAQSRRCTSTRLTCRSAGFVKAISFARNPAVSPQADCSAANPSLGLLPKPSTVPNVVSIYGPTLFGLEGRRSTA